MNIEEFREYCLSLKEVKEKMPFDENTLVFTIRDKMFSLTNIDTFESINLKCKPEDAVVLREQYEAVGPGYHMNKKHWNTIKMNGSIPDDKIKEWVRESYNLVVATLPKKVQKELAEK